MDKSEKTRENILEHTISLINESGGQPEKVTIRKIAAKAQVSVGLVNHYFASKDGLIEECVQKIIRGVIGSFRPDTGGLGQKENLKISARLVMDFLMENPQISRISILGDLANPKAADNTMGTVMGFARRISGNPPDEEGMRRAFMLTSFLQSAFLRKDTLKAALGIDFYDKPQRDSYIDDFIDKILGG